VALVVSLVLSIGSLLVVAAAQAYLTQGQVRLARLQQQLSTEESRHRDLELQVAQLEDPSHVVSKAQQQGLSVPAQVTDLPLVSSGSSDTTTTTTAGGKR
jgi:cell division protein FtsL